MNLLSLDSATDPAVCGHKAATLASLRKLGFDVPDGFVIPAGVRASRDEIEAGLARLGDGAVAVRSSGLAEDLAEASFAGQYDTLLNVRGPDAVLEAAASVVSSGNGRAAAYGQTARPMAVLVQRMIVPDAAGVAFSANPLTGNRDEVCVSATPGLADRLVGGASDADEWLVRPDGARAVALPHNAFGEAVAHRVAAMARKAEEARRSPQDIEWAIEGDRLWLLQSRPITVLPVAPAIAIPEGTWQKDAGHFPDPVTPFAATTQFHYANEFMDEAMQWGLLFDGIRFELIGHEPYVHVDPDDGGKQPPPWWLLGIVARLAPSLRRKLAAAGHAVRSGWLESMPAAWETEHRPRLRAEIERRAATDLTSLSDDALFVELEELRVFYKQCLKLHFSLAVPHSVGLRELAIACEELLGWELQKTVGLLQGLSSSSTAPTTELAAIVRRPSLRRETKELLMSRAPDLIPRLAATDPELAAELRGYLRFWGLRPIGPEAGSPSFAEQPQLLAHLVADLVTGEGSRDLATGRRALAGEARARLKGAARERFDAALDYAERVYPLREDNVLLTDHLPTGLLRRVALDAGRRLVELQLLSRAEDAVMLTADELREALRAHGEVRTVVSRRKAEHAWVRANPGPMTLGPEPGKAPDLKGLPEPARRINAALLWMLEHELTPPRKGSEGEIVGLGASAGVVRGRVRVIRSADQLHTLRTGEVLVCPTTSAAWMMVFERAAAMVTDTGSILTHTAIVAREFALPAVVATMNATSVLVDGDEVLVDGTRGIVTRC